MIPEFQFCSLPPFKFSLCRFWGESMPQVECRSNAASACGRSMADTNTQWIKQIQEWRDELCISQNYLPFDRLRCEIEGLHITPRVRAILNLVVASKVAGKKCKTAEDIRSYIGNIIVDVSQNPARRCFTPSKGIHHCLCTSSQLVHLGLMRVLLPCEYFFLQGHSESSIRFPNPAVFTSSTGVSPPSNRQLRTLAGEGMCLPCLGTIVWCLHLTGAFDVNQLGEIPAAGASRGTNTVDTMTTIDFDSELSLDWPGIVLDDSPLAASMLP